jgi:hypothetical protein
MLHGSTVAKMKPGKTVAVKNWWPSHPIAHHGLATFALDTFFQRRPLLLTDPEKQRGSYSPSEWDLSRLDRLELDKNHGNIPA